MTADGRVPDATSTVIRLSPEALALAAITTPRFYRHHLTTEIFEHCLVLRLIAPASESSLGGCSGRKAYELTVAGHQKCLMVHQLLEMAGLEIPVLTADQRLTLGIICTWSRREMPQGPELEFFDLQERDALELDYHGLAIYDPDTERLRPTSYGRLFCKAFSI